jgi:glycosyltransferase involved in cell wall biosynthesis
MKVLYSQPLTAPKQAPLPVGFEQFGSESDLSSEFARRFPWLHASSERLLRVCLAVKLMASRERFDAVVTGRYGDFFALLQGLLPFGRRPHLLLDVEWLDREGSSTRKLLSRWFRRRVVQGTTRIKVFCHSEARDYARQFKVDATKFVWIPYCTEASAAPDVEPGDFIFASGYHHRDYATLLAAVAGLPVELRIAAPESEFRSIQVPSNVKVLGLLAAHHYWRTLAECRFVVLSLHPNILRRPGVITYVGAMRMGKCVVVNEPVGASSYIDHGQTGFLVPPAEPEALRDQILTLLTDPELAHAVGMKAERVAAERFTPAQYFEAIELALRGAIEIEPTHRD